MAKNNKRDGKVEAVVLPKKPPLEVYLIEAKGTLTPLEEATFFQQLRNQKKKINEIADLCCMDHQVVRQRLELLNLPCGIQNLVHSGEWTVFRALKFLHKQPTPTKPGHFVMVLPRSDIMGISVASHEVKVSVDNETTWQSVFVGKRGEANRIATGYVKAGYDRLS